MYINGCPYRPWSRLGSNLDDAALARRNDARDGHLHNLDQADEIVRRHLGPHIHERGLVRCRPAIKDAHRRRRDGDPGRATAVAPSVAEARAGVSIAGVSAAVGEVTIGRGAKELKGLEGNACSSSLGDDQPDIPDLQPEILQLRVEENLKNFPDFSIEGRSMAELMPSPPLCHSQPYRSPNE